jgi:hypothetical protein
VQINMADVDNRQVTNIPAFISIRQLALGSA